LLGFSRDSVSPVKENFKYKLLFFHKKLKFVNIMAKDLSQIEKNFIDKTGKISKQWGLGEPAGRVWATLLFADTPLSQRQIAEKTGYSLSLVSPSLKILEKLNMIRSIRGESKEKLYELTVSFIEAFNGLIKRFLEQDVKPLIEQLEEVKEIHDPNKKNKLRRLIQEYKRLEMYLSLFTKLMLMKKATVEKVSKLIG
jgi:DNA-binding transcriptional regulator GbsR (MarR family)